MKLNSQYETEINLKDLLFHVLYKWRIILLVGLIMAGIIGFREYWSFEKYHRNGELAPSEVQYEADIEENNRAIAKAEMDVAGYEETLKGLIRYRDTSAIMKMDPRNIWTAEKKYYLNIKGATEKNVSAASDSADGILTVLSEAITDDADTNILIDIFGTDDWKDINETVSVIVNRELHTISAVGCGSTRDEAVKRKGFADEYLQSANKKLQEAGNYSLEMISDTVGTKTVLTTKNANGEREEKDLAIIQNKVNEGIRDYQNQQNTYIGTLNYLQGKTFIKPVPKTVSQAIFGFALGTLSTIILYLLIYFFNGRIKTGKELQKRYDLSLLGEFTHSRAWWKGKGLDWIFEKLEIGKKTDFENELDSIALLMDEAKDGKTILMTGSLEEKILRKVYDGLASRLGERGMELIFEPDYLHNSEAVAASRDLDSVLLVEEKYRSRVRDLNRMAEMLEIEDANVIGAVLL